MSYDRPVAIRPTREQIAEWRRCLSDGAALDRLGESPSEVVCGLLAETAALNDEIARLRGMLEECIAAPTSLEVERQREMRARVQTVLDGPQDPEPLPIPMDSVAAHDMHAHELRSTDAALARIAADHGIEVADLASRVVIEHREVGPATPAPAGSLPRIRIVLDGTPVWQGGWDVSGSTYMGELRVAGWEWCERWMK